MSHSKKVLIVDDDRDFVCAIQTLLEGSGYVVRTANNGRQGIEAAKTFEPDLVLLDVMMTERTEGFFTLQRMRAVPALAQTPIIVISSIYTEQPLFRVNPDAGWLPADLFLPKPIDPARLLAEAEHLVERASKAAVRDSELGGDER